MKLKTISLLLFVMLGLSSCAYLQQAYDWIKEQKSSVTGPAEPTPSPTVPPVVTTPSPTPVPSTPVPSIENPNVNGAIQYFVDGGGGNLWKPVSDTTGNLVIVLHSKWKKEFSGGCSVQKKDGKIETLFCGGPFKCFGNPDAGGERLHMRSNIKCDKAKEVKVTCKEAKQTVVFTVKESAKLSQVCNRHD